MSLGSADWKDCNRLLQLMKEVDNSAIAKRNEKPTKRKRRPGSRNHVLTKRHRWGSEDGEIKKERANWPGFLLSRWGDATERSEISRSQVDAQRKTFGIRPLPDNVEVHVPKKRYSCDSKKIRNAVRRDEQDKKQGLHLACPPGSNSESIRDEMLKNLLFQCPGMKLGEERLLTDRVRTCARCL